MPAEKKELSPARSFLFMAALVLAGEAVFGLPFVIARVFRPTLLDVFGITNLQLGSAFSVYGVVAMLAYFPSGPLADRFEARRLIAFALLMTAVGGLVFARIPSLATLTLLFGFWGLSTILFFWSALIRAARQWGGATRQGRAYGLLDGGRGLFAAVLASITVAIFAFLLPQDVESATLDQRADALGQVILVFTAITAFSAVLVWLWVPEDNASDTSGESSRFEWAQMGQVLRMPALWLQALIVVCAYVGYKCTDDFSLYARDGFGMNDVQAASVGAISFYVRPVAALGAGLLGDHFRSSRVLVWSFVLLILTSGVMGSGLLPPSVPMFFFVSVAATGVAIYALRGVYFSVFEEARVPAAWTGTAAGLVSVVGYTPDIFMGPLMGYLTDRSPGAAGHQHLFLVLAGFGLLGLVAAIAFSRLVGRKG